MAALAVALLCLLACLGGQAERVRYDGFRVVRALPKSVTQVGFLQELTDDVRLDFWSDPGQIDSPVDIMPTVEFYPHLIEFLQNHTIEHSIYINNVQSLIEEGELEQQSIGEPNSFDLLKYNRLKDIFDWLDSVVASCDICSLESIGKSYGGHDLRLIKIGIPGANKKAIFMEGTIHAREWIAPATVLFAINKFVTTYKSDAVVRRILERFDWYILPVLNPDGYEYSHTTNRLWRKTLQPNAGSTCVGTDGNRNFDFKWGGIGSSNNPCSNSYRGPSPHSEPEVARMTSFMMSKKESLICYLALHSRGQMWLTPWGYTSDLPEDYPAMVSVGKIATDALRTFRGTEYKVGSSNVVIYPTSGSSGDWVYAVANTRFPVTIELPGHGYGHVLPPRFIEPVGEETWLAFRAAGEALLEYY